MVAWTHGDLMADLAEHLRSGDRIVWCDMQLGPRASCRPDCFAMRKSFVRPQPTAYEVKASQADFRADVTAGKWMHYLDVSEAVYFAAPSGVITRDQLPERAGLLTRGENGWRAVRAATRSPVVLDESVWLKLVMDGIGREVERHVRGLRGRERHGYLATRAVAKRWGEDVAKMLSDRSYLEDRVANLRRQVEESEARLTESNRRAQESHAGRLRDMEATLLSRVRRCVGLPEADLATAFAAAHAMLRTISDRLGDDLAADLRRTASSLEEAAEQLEQMRRAACLESA